MIPWWGWWSLGAGTGFIFGYMLGVSWTLWDIEQAVDRRLARFNRASTAEDAPRSRKRVR